MISLRSPSGLCVVFLVAPSMVPSWFSRESRLLSFGFRLLSLWRSDGFLSLLWLNPVFLRFSRIPLDSLGFHMASSFRFSCTSSHSFLKFLHGFPDVPYGFFIVSIYILMSLLRISLWVFLVFLLAFSCILYSFSWLLERHTRGTEGHAGGGHRRGAQEGHT